MRMRCDTFQATGRRIVISAISCITGTIGGDSRIESRQ